MASALVSAVWAGPAAARTLSDAEALAQVAVSGGDTAAVVVDADDVRGRARAAQAGFERARERYFPITFASGGGPCDEQVGRLCLWYGEGEWIPGPEPPEARALRAAFLAELDSLQAMAPDDAWILGQRVWYRGEGDDWAGALDVARGCGAERWWCEALTGLALHGSERFEAAQEAFGRALVSLEASAPELARRWRMPEQALDREGRAWLRAIEAEGAEAVAGGLDLLWTLADPLWLVDGNDRLTEHYARWTVATLKDGARNPFRLRWGGDLEELTVRHGWELGWERSPSARLGGPFDITGHRHPEGREFMPSGATLRAPQASTAEGFLADRRRPVSLHTPRYAPILMPMEGQVALFPRGEQMVLVASAFLPPDTSFHAEHTHPRPWMEAREQAGSPDRHGLFALTPDGSRRFEEVGVGTAEGALMVELPTGAYVVSVESWSPERRRAGRLREGIDVSPTPPDVAVLSDLVLLRGGGTPPATLREALPSLLPSAEVRAGERLAIAWEVSGLGLRPEVLRYTVSVDRTDQGVFRRLGTWIGLASRPPGLGLSWEEPGPESPTHWFRALDLDLPGLEAGRYEVRLVLSTAGRSDVVARRGFRVVDR